MMAREELLELLRTDPQRMVKHVLDLQGQLTQELRQAHEQIVSVKRGAVLRLPQPAGYA
jgi:hypothetical protein